MQDLQIAQLFNQCFAQSHDTILRGGAQEPLYLPGNANEPAQLWYREDFAASALHEIAHWCVAGGARRRLVDFGYVYSPPPRSPQAQAAFFASELKVQTLEMLFAQTAGVPFTASADNLQADVRGFTKQIHQARNTVAHWMRVSRDQRAAQFHQILEGHFG
ncbi:MAG: elongation factor P hydroxylase [Pseudomonadota bacterium]